MIPNFILSIITGEASAAARRARLSAIEYFVAAIAAVVGFIFLLMALYIYAARFYGELAVATAFGIISLTLAAIVLIYHRVRARARARRARQRMSNDAMALVAPLALAILPSLLNKRGALLGAAVPVLSAIAYAIYRENSGSNDDDIDDAG